MFCVNLRFFSLVLFIASVLFPETILYADDALQADPRNMLERLVDRLPHEERKLPWLRGDFNVWSGLASVAVIGVAVDRAGNDDPVGGLGGQDGSEGPVVQLGHDLYTVIPGAATISTLAARDWRGFVYMGIHNVASSGVTQFLKDEVSQGRPGNQSDTSFPSGHATGAFLGAAFLQQRYGPRVGIPSYISALLVGWSRIYGNKHYINDVVGSASISMLSAWAIVPPYDQERLERWRDLERERKFRYEWEMTLNDVNRNEIQSPGGVGDVFSSPLDRGEDEPWANSHVAFEYRLDGNATIHGQFSPWEIRSFGEFAQPTSFAGILFPANEQLRSAHLMWTYGAQYRRTLVTTERLSARWGLGISGQYTEEEIFVVDETQPEKRGLSAKSDASAWYAAAHLDASVKLIWKLYLEAEADVGLAAHNQYVDWRASLAARLSPKWDLALGWREFETDLKDDALRNDFRRTGPALTFGYAF